MIEKVKVKPKPGLLENRTHSLRWLANINSRSFKPQRKRILNLWTSLEGDSPILISDKKLALYSISVQLKKKGRNKKEISGQLWKGICQFLISGKKLTLYSISVQQKKKGRNKKETGFEISKFFWDLIPPQWIIRILFYKIFCHIIFRKFFCLSQHVKFRFFLLDRR